MNATTMADTRSERAIWGLVDDRYDVAARTPSLSADEARRLCRVADMGDPSTPLDDAVAYLVAPEWGPVFARYYTNAHRDSGGRLTIVYDVVRPCAELLAAARYNPFRLFPALPAARTIHARGELDAPTLAGADGNDADRLAALLESMDERAVTELLAAVLDGGPVLWLADASATSMIETIVLLLPPELRARFTFQSHTLNRPANLPLLTVAEHQVGSLRDVSWSGVLPRDRGNLSSRAVAAAGALIGLARDEQRSSRAQQVYARLGELDNDSALLPAVEQLLRLDRFFADRDRSDVIAALASMGDAASAGERAAMSTELATAFDAAELAAAVAELVERSPASGWTVVASLTPVLAARAENDPAASAALDGIVVRVASVWLPDDASSALGRSMLARRAADMGNAEAMVLLLPREGPPPGEPSEKSNGDSAAAARPAALGRFVELQLSRQQGIGTIRELIQVAGRMTGALSSRRATQRLSGLILAATRRAIATSGTSCSASELESLRAELLSFWERCAPSGELDAAAKRVFTMPNSDARAAARSLAAALARDPERPGIAEYVGWIRLLMALPNGTASAAAFASTCASSGELATHIGALVRTSLREHKASLLSPDWLALLDLSDARTRRDLLIEALADAITHAGSGGAVGAVSDACVALGERGLRLDAEAAAPVVAALARLGAHGPRTSAALRLRLACAAVESIGDDDVSDAIANVVWGESADLDVVAGRMWLASAALHAVERIRPASEFAALCDAASTDLSWRSALPPEHARRIGRFLRLGSSSSLVAMIRRELPNEQPTPSLR